MSDELGVKAGQVIADTYRLVALLGKGGMGSVWRCDHLSLMSTVALKVIKPEVAKNANSVARFMREAKAAAMLRSPHVVQILDHGMQGAIAYIAMELLEGESLHQRLKRKSPVGAAETARIMTHVGRAMQKAHDIGIVHRDLKPDNVFLVENDDEIIAKVLDFGIAKSAMYSLNATGESPQTQTGALLGTPYYMSPEQATGQKDVDHRSDLWAIAVITFECLIGRRPYQSDSLGDLVLQICSRPQPIPSHMGRVPPGFDAWFAKAQARDPAERFQTAKELTGALREVLTGDRRSSVRSLPRPSMPPRRPSIPPDVAHDKTEPAPLKKSVPIGTMEPASQVSSQATPFDSGSAVAVLTPAAASLEPPVAASGHDDARSAASGAHDALTSQTAPSPGLGLETLDPLAATTAPGRRRGLLMGGMIGAAGIVLGIGVAIYFSTIRQGPATDPAAAGVTAEQAAPEASGPDVSAGLRTGASAEPEPTPAEPPASSASLVPSSATAPEASTAPRLPVLPRVVLPKPLYQPTPRPPAPPPPPKPPPPPHDPLGI